MLYTNFNYCASSASDMQIFIFYNFKAKIVYDALSQCLVTWLVGKTWKPARSFLLIQANFKTLLYNTTSPITSCFPPETITAQEHQKQLAFNWVRKVLSAAAEHEVLMEQDCWLLIIYCTSCSLSAWGKLACLCSFCTLIWSSIKEFFLFSHQGLFYSLSLKTGIRQENAGWFVFIF